MKRLILAVMICLVFSLSLYAQEDESILINDFEFDLGTWTGWVQFTDFTAQGDPVHGGEWAAYLDALNESGWNDARYTFPEPVDATGADEFRMWVYSDDIFRLRADIGVEVPLGFRNYGPEDVGTWKEFVFWISEEQSKLWFDLLSNLSTFRFWINPGASTQNGVAYPDGFSGTVFIDDMVLKKRVPVEREYLPLIGFNQKSEEALVSLAGGGSYFEVDTTGGPGPTEGDGVLMFEFTSGWTENITIDLHDFPQILQYDRIHLDIFHDSSASWAATALVLQSSWVDKNGNSHGTDWATLSENILGSAIGDWGELSGQYGPVDSEGFTNNWVMDEIAGVFDDPNGTLTLTFTSQGADAAELALTYIDNIRLSRPAGTAVQCWELH